MTFVLLVKSPSLRKEKVRCVRFYQLTINFFDYSFFSTRKRKRTNSLGFSSNRKRKRRNFGRNMFLTIFSTVIGMEIFSWFIHKYLFHGPLWFIHKTHHETTNHKQIEFNDMFSCAFASASIYLIYSGVFTPSLTQLAIGIGITVYGMIYFLVHDGIIHQRYSTWQKTTNPYLRQVVKAHQSHHASPYKTPSEEFGLFLIMGRKYWHDVFF